RVPPMTVGSDERDQALVQQPPEGLFGEGAVVTECRVAVRAQEAATLDERARDREVSPESERTLRVGDHGNELDCQQALGRLEHERTVVRQVEPGPGELEQDGARPLQAKLVRRSEERRVGKEGR